MTNDNPSFVFNATQNGDGQINQGQHVTAHQTHNHGSQAIDIEKLLAAIVESIPEPERPKAQSEAVEPLREILVKELPEDEAEQASIKDRIIEYVGKLEPYMPYIRKTVAAFAEGALTATPPPASWLVGGLMEVIRDARRD